MSWQPSAWCSAPTGTAHGLLRLPAAPAFRLWLRDEIDAIADLVRDTQTSIVELAARHADAVMPGYTHLQRAQPVMFAHWCLAYFEMLKRDRDRLADARKRVNILPLGSGALAGAGFPVDREAVARELGFEGISANSLDAVSDRDLLSNSHPPAR